MNNKIIKCENNFALSLARNYGANELKTLSAVLQKMTSLISVEEQNDNVNVTGCITEEGNLEVEVDFEFFKDILYKSNSKFSDVEKMCVSLLNIKFQYYSFKGETKLCNYIPIFKKISKNEEERKFTFVLNENFNEFLMGLKENFTMYELSEFKEISRNASQQLYLMGRRYVNVNGGIIRMKIETFRSLMSIDGKYERMHDLTNFIDRNIKVVEKETNLKIKWSKEKEGKKVKYITLKFQYSKQLYNKKEVLHD